MHLILPDLDLPTRVILGDMRPLGDDEFFDFCVTNPDLRIERNAKGEIVIVPPAGGESDYRNSDLHGQVWSWAKRDKRGKAFGSSVCFLLPDGSGLSPDVAWVDSTKLNALTKETRKKFLPVVPDFVAEVMSPSDRLKAAQEKMEQWVANGVSLAWLIDGDHETVYVYRRGQAVAKYSNVDQLAADPPMTEFVADLADIWEGL